MTPQEYMGTAKPPRSKWLYLFCALAVAAVTSVGFLLLMLHADTATISTRREVVIGLVLFGFFFVLTGVQATISYSNTKNQFQTRRAEAETYNPQILRIAREYKVKPPLVDAIIREWRHTFQEEIP